MRVWQITNLMLFMLLGWAPPPAHAQQAPLAGLDEYVNKAMKDWDVPGLAIAVIKDDRIVLAQVAEMTIENLADFSRIVDEPAATAR